MVTYRTFRGIAASIRYITRSIERLRHKHGNCPICGGVLLVREGKYGRFLGCSNYPRCRYTRNN